MTPLTHERVTMGMLGGPVKRTKYFRFPCSPRVKYAIHDNCVSNLYRGTLERVFYVEVRPGVYEVPAQPTVAEFGGRVTLFNAQYRKRVRRAVPVSYRQVVEMYRGRKRAIYERARVSLETEPLRKDDAKVKLFGKREKTNFSEKPNPPQRVIYPREPRYNLAVAAYLKPLEHEVYRTIDHIFHDRHSRAHRRTVVKGLNFSQRGQLLHEKWRRFRRPRGLLFDAKRFDQHVSVAALKHEHSVYLQHFRGQDKSQLKKLLSWQLKTTAKGRCPDGWVKFVRRGGRCSGDINTALGNVTIMCSLFFDYLESLGIDYEFVDDGDDSVLVVEMEDVQCIIDTYEAWFLHAGFRMKLGRIAVCLEEVEFCQTHPVYDGAQWTMIRDPHTAMAKDSVCLLPLHIGGETFARRWLAAVSECGEAVAGAIPVWDAFYRCLRRASKGAKPLDPESVPGLESGMFIQAKGMRRRFGPVSEDARYHFWVAYGLAPTEQISIEEFFDSYEMDLRALVVPYEPKDAMFLSGCDVPVHFCGLLN